MKIAIIGGGAAGFFAALTAKKEFPKSEVTIYEKAAKALGKVKISGGGRCNVTHACSENKLLATQYPRGENYLKKSFEQFNADSTVHWFKERGVEMKTFPDGCVFPLSNDSQTIIDCFLSEASKLGVKILYNHSVVAVEKQDAFFTIQTREKRFQVDRLVITIGGQPKRSGLAFLENIGHAIIEPVPSLFTFNMPDNPIRELMGNVVEKATVKVEGTKLLGKGPLLVTHWGMSGPAILQLSAWGARVLEDKKYEFAVLVNWLNEVKEDELRKFIDGVIFDHGLKMIGNLNPFPVTNRLWHFLLQKSEITQEIRWKDIGKRNLNKLVNTLINDRYEVKGKTTFKEEFVTAGGVSLQDVDIKTMESRKVEGLFLAGEVLDIDGITGGFNFQSAWTTGFVAGRNCGK